LNFIIRFAKKNTRIYNILYDAVSAEKSYKNTLLSMFKRQK